MICDSWKDCGVRQGGCCQLGLYGGRPSLGVCAKCDQRTVDGVKPEKSQFELIKKYNLDYKIVQMVDNCIFKFDL